MKSITKIITCAFIICLIPFSIVVGQEKKNEQRIKIIIDDGSGKKVVIDTLLTDSQMTDSLKLKNGDVIFVGRSGDKADLNHHGGDEQVFVTVSADGKDTRKVVKKITIASSDSASRREDGERSKTYVYSDSNTPEDNKYEQHRVIRRSDKDGAGQGEKVIIMDDRKVNEKEGGETIRYSIKSDNKESDVERTKYVITKDGMVITIEGKDYDKVKELVKEIESKLDIKNDGAENARTGKEEQKKAVKKK